MKRAFTVIVLFLGLTVISGCASVISRGVLQQVDPNVTFASVFKNPDAYRGKVVVWGGVIISASNLKEGTLIEVLEKPLGFQKRPSGGDETGGRFLALYDGYLDTAVFAKGREVTVAGVIQGGRTKRLDEIDYRYPLIAIKEIHLWKNDDGAPPPFYPYAYGYWGRFHYWPYDPFWYSLGYPYWYPYW
jgi:outer membrane lipoprotein